jgi:hypothetical protein
MSKVEGYRSILRDLDFWDPYLLEESKLPGPRANLELAFAVALEGAEPLFVRYAALDAAKAPANTREEFLAFCGVLGLGYLLASGRMEFLDRIREAAKDPRWRAREAVALGLQQYGKADMEGLLAVAKAWSQGDLLERRAVVAAICEPQLLQVRSHAAGVFDLLDLITESVLQVQDVRADAFKSLRKTLGYGWSVAVVAHPAMGKARMERWVGVDNGQIRWIMNQNLKKNRLVKMDAGWVEDQLNRLYKAAKV